MEKLYYDAESLERVLAALERQHGMSSAEFHTRHTAGEHLEIPRFTTHVWASFYRDVRRLRGDGFAETAERLLALA
jgi:hypothetical protein